MNRLCRAWSLFLAILTVSVCLTTMYLNVSHLHNGLSSSLLHQPVQFPSRPSCSTHLSAHSTICVADHVQGSPKPNAILTILINPKPLSDNATSLLNLQLVLKSWSLLDGIDVIVMSSRCSLLYMAHEAGLMTLMVNANSDIEVLTYRYAFRMIASAIPSTTPLVGYCNSDIMFDSSLYRTLDALLRYAKHSRKKSKTWRSWFAVGERTNLDLPQHISFDPERSADTVRDIFEIASNKSGFGAIAQDYFIFTRNIDVNWDDIPPFFIGGVYFDNWFTSFMYDHYSVQVIDTSGTILAVHLNHGRHRLESRHNLASEINNLIGMKTAIAMGSLDRLPYMTNYSASGDVRVNFRKKRWIA